MMPKDKRSAAHQINHESSIITSDSNKDLKKRIQDISQQVLKRN